jgi:hypothetical protein
MVLTRAQRAQKTTEPEAPKSARATKAKATSSTTTTTKATKPAAPKAKKVVDPVEEDKENEDPKPVKKASRATSTTASAAAKSKTVKPTAKEEEEKPKTKTTRARKQVQFAEDPVQETVEPELSASTTSTRGRSRKTPVAAPSSTTKTTAKTTKATITVKETVSARGRARKTPVAEAPVVAKKDATKELKSSVLGKPIRPKKAADAPKATGTSQAVDSTTDSSKPSSLEGPEPKMAPPIRSPTKMVKNTLASASMMQPLAFPALESSLASPSQTLGSPMRLGPRLNPFDGESPVRASPMRPLQSSLSQASTLGMPAQPVFSNLLLQSPVRPSVKKLSASQVSPAKALETPLRSIGTPIRRKLNASSMTMPFPQTAAPQKRSFMESPRRPKSAQAPKRTKLNGTPEESNNSDDTETLSALETFRKMNNVKKSVSFESPQAQEHGPQPFVDVQSSLHQFHRISAVTEVTEPEESVEDVFSINPTMEAMQSPTPMVETIDEDIEMNEPADISMSNILGADFAMSDALEEPETVVEAILDVETVKIYTVVELIDTLDAFEAEPVEEAQQIEEIELIGAIEPLGDVEPFEDVQQIEELMPIEQVEITGAIEPLGNAEPFEDVEQVEILGPVEPLGNAEPFEDIEPSDMTEMTETTEPVQTVDLIDLMESVDTGFEMEMAFDAPEIDNHRVETASEELPEEKQTLVEPVIAELELELLTEALTSESVEVEAVNEPTLIAEPIESEIGLAFATDESVIEGMSNDVVVEVLQDIPAPVESTIVETEMVETEAAEAFETAPEPLTLLNGMTFLVDVWAADGTNANQFFAPLLHDLGATVVNEWNNEVTHVLFKDGTADTLQRAAASEGTVRCLNVGWAVE